MGAEYVARSSRTVSLVTFSDRIARRTLSGHLEAGRLRTIATGGTSHVAASDATAVSCRRSRSGGASSVRGQPCRGPPERHLHRVSAVQALGALTRVCALDSIPLDPAPRAVGERPARAFATIVRMRSCLFQRSTDGIALPLLSRRVEERTRPDGAAVEDPSTIGRGATRGHDASRARARRVLFIEDAEALAELLALIARFSIPISLRLVHLISTEPSHVKRVQSDRF